MLVKGHSTRLITGLCILIMLGLALYFDGWVLFFVILATSLAAQYEFYNMFWPSKRFMLPEKIAGLTTGAALILAVFLQEGTCSMFCVILACVFGAMSFLVRFGSGQENASFSQSMLLLAGFAYVPLIMQLTFGLDSLEVLLILLAVCSSDAAAYYAGTAFGKRKIWPRVSPKKSVLGSVAGLAACTLAVTLFGTFLLEESWLHWLFAGMILNIMAQLGDFFESALKRSIDVKDSGNLLPGHGGMLDRIDSFLFAMPTYVLLKLLFLP